jgi:hypothetical protein
MSGRGGGPLSTRGILIVALAALGLGMFLGVNISRRRQRARDLIISIAPPATVKDVSDAFITQTGLLRELQLMLVPVSQEDPITHKTSLVPTPAKQPTIDALILKAQRLQFYKWKRAMPKPPEFQRHLAELSQTAEFQQKLGSIKAAGRTEEELQGDERVQMASEKLLAGIPGRPEYIQVSDIDKKLFYTENILPDNPNGRFRTPEMAKVQVIVTQSDAKHSGFEYINSALAELNRGVPMNSVAQKYNVLNLKQYPNGLLPIVHRGWKELDNIPGLEDQIFKLKATEQSAPIKLIAGDVKQGPKTTWWIIKCLRHTPYSFQPYTRDIQEECRIGVVLADLAFKPKKGVRYTDDELRDINRIQTEVKRNGVKLQEEFAEFRKRSHVQYFNGYEDASKTPKAQG